MREREHHEKAFEFYYALGEGRSYKQVADEFSVSLGTVKLWGRSFDWTGRIAERDADVARAMADRSMKKGIERGFRNSKIIEMALVRVAKAIAEGEVKMTVSDLDRLIRLEEYLTEGPGGPAPMKLVVEWTEYGNGDDDKTEDDSEED
jgi:transposase